MHRSTHYTTSTFSSRPCIISYSANQSLLQGTLENIIVILVLIVFSLDGLLDTIPLRKGRHEQSEAESDTTADL